MQVQFYHLLATNLERALPALVSKAHQAKLRTLIRCRDRSTLQMLDDHLWAFDPNSFLPHGTEADKQHREDQPILLTTGAENHNQASLMMVTDGSMVKEEETPGITRLLDIFNGHDDQAVTAARQRWKGYKEKNYDLTYIRQQADGSWKKEG